MPSRDYYLKGLDDPILVAYREFAINVAVLLGATKERAEQDVIEMLDFEVQLANVNIFMF